ncbi:MAG: hypothetical protein ACRCUJ_06560 [Phocaeicola sp.]
MKELIQLTVVIILLFILFAGFELKTNPFSIKFPNLWAGIGFVLVIIGSCILYGIGYENGRNEVKDVIERAIEIEKKELEQ